MRKTTATKQDKTMISLMGGYSFEGNDFTHDQVKRLKEVYGYNGEDPSELNKAGSFKNLMRDVSHDGRRVMAFLSSFLEEGEDPVRFIAEALADLSYDVDVDLQEDFE